jgi:uncharacterized protein (DUF433 family)
MTEAAELAFTAREAQGVTGLSNRRLQYWDEIDFIRPSVAARQGRGWPRLYSFRDLIQLRIAAQLRGQLSLQALQRLKAALDVDAPFAELRFAVLGGNEVVYLGPTGQAEAVMTPGQIVLTFDVPLQEIRADLQGRVRELRTRHHVGEVSRTRCVMGSKPVMRGTRITPASIVRMLADGWTEDRVLDEFPDLVPADIAAAVAFKQKQHRAG